MTTDTANPNQSELRAIVDAMPQPKNSERLRAVAALLHCKETTIRGWLLKNPHRNIPDKQLALLRDAVARASAEKTPA